MAGYHHGNLRDAILAAAASAIARDGIGGLSLRAIAADIGVSHTAFRRHFGSREGVLDGLAVQGNRWLADELTAAAGAGEFRDVGVAYVRFALDHPGHFTVMFRTDLLDDDDPEVIATRATAIAPLRDGIRAQGTGDPTAAMIAAWGLVHGIASLALGGAFQESPEDVEDLARRALALLFPS
ncbi:TetR-like C-terminal domain-containing protein [Actinoplanes sp. NPDC051475]|uniref:TetR-like C-terminal domain-containing protein n=1 Tax=Actinoplanes sp. NPDC051475 TaxID=3157225 RepID=UPI00344EC397